jgi:hypothetical protein
LTGSGPVKEQAENFILKELIIGLISLIFIIIGSYFLISPFLIWKEKN